MRNTKRIDRLKNNHFTILDVLEKYENGKLRFYDAYYRLVDKNKNPIANIKKYLIDDLIEHNYITKEKSNFKINKI